VEKSTPTQNQGRFIMRKKQNSYDRTGSSSDFSNNEGYQNYQDRIERGFNNPPHYTNKQRNEQGADYAQSRSGYVPSNTSDASMYGADYQASSQSERFDARNNGNYGFGGYSSARAEGDSQPSNSSGNFSWQTSERKSGLHTGKGPKGYRRSDERVREDVSETLSAHPEIDASEIEIEVKEGLVTLSGTVESRKIKRLVEDAIEAISGVQDIKNDLRVMAITEHTGRAPSSDADLTSSRSGQVKTNLAGRQNSSTSLASGKSVQ